MKKIKFLYIIIMISLLSGCMFQAGDDLLKAPQAPKNYLELSTMLDQIITGDMTYATPLSGQNRNPVQLIDLDSDGIEEAVSFFRESPTLGEFTVYIHKIINGEYEEIGVITGDGAEIESVHYPKFGANGTRGIIICWKLGPAATKGMTVASFVDDGTIQTLYDTEYVDFTYTDMDTDGLDEIVTIVSDPITSKLRARLFDFDGDSLDLESETALSFEATDVSVVHSGHITPTENAVFVESKIKDRTGLITDALAVVNGSLTNITIGADDDLSSETYREISVLCDDKNGNNIYEIPKLVKMKGYNQEEDGEILYYIEWYEYTLSGSSERVLNTYQHTGEEWQIIVPEVWKERVSAVRRTDGIQNYTSFEVYDGDFENNTVLLEVYAFTGDDKIYMSSQPGHFTLGATETVIYTAKIPQDSKNNSLALGEGEILANFSILQTAFMNFLTT